MAKKKHEKDAVADFFGDGDLEWLEDEDSQSDPSEDAKPDLAEVTPKPAEQTRGPSADPNAATVMLSSVPTIPPSEPASDGPPPPPADPPAPATVAVAPPPPPPPFAPSSAMADTMPKTVQPEPAGFDPDRTHPFMEAPDLEKVLPPEAEEAPEVPDVPRMGSEPDEQVSSVPEASEPEVEVEVEVEVEGADEGSSGEPPIPAAPSIRPPKGMTPRPAPTRQVAPPTAKQRAQTEQGWRGVLSTLEAEANAADAGAARAGILEQATFVAANEIKDLDRAVELYGRAREAGSDSTRLMRTQAEVLGRLGRYSEQQSLFIEMSARHEREARADALVDAGLVAWRRLDQASQAVEHFRSAARVDPEDFTARALLRSLWPSTGTIDPSQRTNLLDELATLSEAGIAADFEVEAASIALAEGSEERARSCLQAALEADPGHAKAFLMLEALLRGEPEALAALYDGEATRAGQTDPGWWHAEAARCHQRADNQEAAVRAFNAAVEHGYPFALRELQGNYVQAGRWFELEDALQREAAVLTAEEGRAFALYRLGWLREARLDNREGALSAYQQAVQIDPTSAPAADGVARLLRDQPHLRVDLLRERIERATLAGERRYLTLQLAESAEHDGDLETARGAYETAVAGESRDATALVARAGMERVLRRLQDRSGLAALRRQQAALAENASERSLYLHEAASILSGPLPEWPPADTDQRDAAIADLRSALEAEPDHPATIGSITLLLEAAGQWRQLANVLQAAGDASEEGTRRAAFYYRAGRVFADRANDDSAARACLTQSLLAEPSFRPARWLLRSVSGPTDTGGDASVYREEAKYAEGRSERAWGLFAAAEAAGPGPTARRDLQRILGEHVDHAGALASLEVHCVAEGDEEALVNIYLQSLEGNATATRARIGARAAALLMRAGKYARAAEVLRRVLRMHVDGRPLRACARLATQLEDPALALEILEDLEEPEDVVERARHLAEMNRPADALRLLSAVIAEPNGPITLVAAGRAAALAQELGQSDAELASYGTIAMNASRGPIIAAYGAWKAAQLLAAGKDDEALPYWRRVHDARPGSESALDGRVRGLVASGGTEELTSLLGDRDPEWLALALGEAGYPGLGAEALLGAIPRFEHQPSRQMVAWLLTERLSEEAKDWDGVHVALAARRRLSNDPHTIAQVEEKQHWLLAEHLAQTDAAWETYQRLHDESPSDRDVTEALARIAGARGEVDTAIRYLRELAQTAPTPADAARYQRRVGEVYERAQRHADARQSYLTALDHVPTDSGSLDGLKRLSESEEDWPGLVAVLQREASIAEGERKVDLRRQIAQITEQHIPDPNVAIDAWRTLVELAPRDKQGLSRLLALAEAQQNWDLFVEVGNTMAQVLEGSERAVMLRRVGIVCEDQLGRDDAVRYYHRAVAQEPPDAIAAQRLERHARARADWAAAVEALSYQSKADIGQSAQVAALLAAARIEVDARHDKDAASSFYRRVLELEPNNEPALRFMSTHLFEAGRYGEAMPVFRRLEPVVEQGQDLEDFDVRMELGSFFFYFAEMLRRQGNPGEALARYERTLELNPTHLPSLTESGPLYVDAERWEAAERVYRSLLQLSGGQGDPEVTATHYTSLGLVERQLGNSEKAYKRFNKALDVFPNHVGALKGMALILEDREDWGNLLNIYNNVIYHANEAEDVTDAYMTKGRILDRHMNRQDKAAQHYQRCLDFDPHQPLALLRLAELALRRDAYREAGELAERALQLDVDLVRPLRALLLMVRAVVWESVGRRSEASRCLREATVLDRALAADLGESPLDDIAGMRALIGERIPVSLREY